MMRAAALLEARGDAQGGVSLLRRALQHDPWREDLYQAALRLQMVAGQRSAAIETYMTCRSRLVEDLGIDPSSETKRLYEQVLGMEEGPAEYPL
jgi:DNA-binding SARP family transcriptional activator